MSLTGRVSGSRWLPLPVAGSCSCLLLLPLAPAAETFVAYGDDDATDASSRCRGSDDDVAKFIE